MIVRFVEGGVASIRLYADQEIAGTRDAETEPSIADRVVGEFDSKSRALSAAQNASERDEGGEYRVYELVGTWMTGEKEST